MQGRGTKGSNPLPSSGESIANLFEPEEGFASTTYLDPGESAVGTAVNMRHLAATSVRRLVSGEAEVTKVDGRQIEFRVRATKGAKEIGVGSHSRVVIDVAKFTRPLE